MKDSTIKSTYEQASRMLDPFIRSIEPGDIAAPIDLRDQDGRKLNLFDDHLSGKALCVLLINSNEPKHVTTILKALIKLKHRVDESGLLIYIVSSASCAKVNQQIKQSIHLPWPICGDPSGSVFASYGLKKGEGPLLRAVLLTQLRQIKSYADFTTELNNFEYVFEDFMEYSKTTSPEEHLKWFPCHAPVLIIPNVLSISECDRLIQLYENQGELKVAKLSPHETKSDYKMPIYEHDRQDRIDHMITQREVLSFLDQKVSARVNPLIHKAFSFTVTRREDFHIARYQGARDGIEMGHRDNTSHQTAYRRFAFSMNLNDNYEGGEIVFKEFSSHGYKPPAGSVMIFSSSLLHEVKETTSGTRFALITHLFNDQGMPRR